MAVYQGSLTVKRRAKDGVGGPPGLPGQVPIQKEWVVGDTHRFNDGIKDFIYVRGVSGNTSYWYTRTSKGDVVAGAAPVGGANIEGYTRVDWMRNLAVMVLLAEEANLANFIFKDERLISVRGTVNGVEVDYNGQANFKPYIIIDGKTGKIYAEGAEISGVIKALSGEIGNFSIQDGMLKSSYSETKSIWNYSKFPPEYVGERTVNGEVLVSVDAVELNETFINQGIPNSVKTSLTSDGINIESFIGLFHKTKAKLEGGCLSIEYTNTNTGTVTLIEVFSDGIYFNGQKFTGEGGGYVHPATHPASMITAGTFPGIVKANNNTSYTTKQVRNMILSTGDASAAQMANGDIWIKYE